MAHQSAPEQEKPALPGLQAGAMPEEKPERREGLHRQVIPLTEPVPEDPMPDGLREVAGQRKAAPPETAGQTKAATAEAAEQTKVAPTAAAERPGRPAEMQKDEPALPEKKLITHAAGQHTEVPPQTDAHELPRAPAQAVLLQSVFYSQDVPRKEDLQHPRQLDPAQEEHHPAQRALVVDYRRSSI